MTAPTLTRMPLADDARIHSAATASDGQAIVDALRKWKPKGDTL